LKPSDLARGIPSWGRVVAQPHHFLVHIRRGRVKTSGHGASCFKWPADSVALIPTCIAKLAFVADQVTREKVGVEVTGLAVYRIAEPLLAYRMIDGDAGRLSEILRDMFVGATRRIVAGLSLDECITHRKERVARALLAEIAPILSGQGELADTTGQGWGVVIDTIEIQNVRVLSEDVFAKLQAPYRESLALEALRAHEHVAEEQAKIGLARLRAEEQGRRAMLEEEQARIEAERAHQSEHAHHAETMRRAALDFELAHVERKERADAERARRQLDAQLERARREAAAAIEIDRTRLEVRREQGELEASLTRLAREARTELSDRQLEELVMTETLPRMAEAFRASFDRIHVTSTGGPGGELFAFLSAGLEQVVQATRGSAGDVRQARREERP